MRSSLLLRWFIRWETSGHTAAVSWVVATRICSKHRVLYVCRSHYFLQSLYIYIYIYIYESKYGLKFDSMKVAWMIPNDLYIWKLTCRCVFLNKREVLSRFFGKSNIFKYVSSCQTRSYDFWIMNAMRTFMYLFVVYFFICSCHLSKHPSLCKLFWYPSPDDGYWNRNVNVDFTS